MQRNTLIIFAHPNLNSSISNKRIIESISLLKNIKIHSLYNLYPNLKIDILYEQQALIKSDIIIFQFPIFWFSSPYILKIWQDQVLNPGFAFGSTQKDFKLKNKNFLISVTTGGNRKKYHSGNQYQYTLDETLRPLQMMANYCQMIYKGYIQSNGRFSIKKENLDKEINQHINKLITFIENI